MSSYIRPSLDSGRGGDRDEAFYSCGNRHDDGRGRSRKKADVDAVTDRELVWLLRRHPSWATAAEMEPSPEALAEYAQYLTAKIAAYDAHIGAACKDPKLSQQRAELGARLRQVSEMRERGAFAVADLAGNHAGRYIYGEPDFSDLARALLTTRIEVSPETITVTTPFDTGTQLYRTLRAREIRDELADLQRRQHELADELTELGEE
jgi:hypothetical protein